MPDLDQLRDLGDQVRPPAFESLERVARRRGHRTAGAMTAACAAVLLVVGGVVVTNDDDHAAPPVGPVAPTPSTLHKPTQEPRPEPGARTSMSPREVVNADNATLWMAGMSSDDPDVRLSVWRAECVDCPVPEGARSHPSFLGMALTTDGYATSTYLSSPIDEGVIESPTPDQFLLHDTETRGPYLVGTDGTVRRVASVDTPIAPKDPRLWFQCLSATIPDEPTWCALDPETATSYTMPGSWGNGLDYARPGSGEEPWGIRLASSGNELEAWWDVDGSRHALPVSQWPGRPGGVVRNPPGGGPMWWSWTRGADTVEVLVGRDRHAAWQVETRSGVPMMPSHLTLSGTPDGGLLAVRIWPRTKIWRADDLLTGDFSLVYDAGPGTENRGGGDVLFVGDEIRIIDGEATVVSGDDGRTWTAVSTWRRQPAD